jgi:hypothetical protein
VSLANLQERTAANATRRDKRKGGCRNPAARRLRSSERRRNRARDGRTRICSQPSPRPAKDDRRREGRADQRRFA